MANKEILDAVKKSREGAKKRNFKQTFDLAIAFKDLDLKKQEHKVKEDVVLPHGRGKPVKIGAIAEGELADSIKKAGVEIIVGKDKLEKLAANKADAKKLVNKVDFLVAQPDLMVTVGKTLGSILGPRNKMPTPVPPQGNPAPILARLNRLVNLRLKDQPVIHCPVGVEDMADEQVAENVEAVLNALKNKLPKGETNIRSTHLKMTMGPAIKIGGGEIQ